MKFTWKYRLETSLYTQNNNSKAFCDLAQKRKVLHELKSDKYEGCETTAMF